MVHPLLDALAANLQSPDPGGKPSDGAILSLAKVVHEANKAFCETEGDFSQKPWDETSEEIRRSAVAGIQALIADPNLPPSGSHDAWMKQKEADGWVYGKIKDAEKKTHPSLIPYDQLSLVERYKDYLFRSIVKGYLDFLKEETVDYAPATVPVGTLQYILRQ